MHPLVKRAVQLTGYKRQKRGYTGLLITPEQQEANFDSDRGLETQDPTDPFFQYQWYLVSKLGLFFHIFIVSFETEKHWTKWWESST